MRIVSYYRGGAQRCGVLDRHGRVYALPARVAADNAQETLVALLGRTAARRDRLEREVLAGDALSTSVVDALGPAVPAPPLYIYNHGNAPTIFKRQSGGAVQWQLPRVPHLRVRPWSCLAGAGCEVQVPGSGDMSYGTELGVVIGRDAYQVTPQAAADYIAGMVPLNDGYLHIHQAFDTNTADRRHNVHVHAIDTLGKSCDGAGGVGPAIITSEELERDYTARVAAGHGEQMRRATGKTAALYDLLTRNYRGGVCVDRSHTSSLLLDAEHLIALLSRALTLPAGSIVGLGAAGWDGQRAQLGDQAGARVLLATQVEDYGRMEMAVERATPAASPLLAARTRHGLDPLPAERPPALWVLRGNYRQANELEGIPEWVGASPYAFPAGVRGAAGEPLVLPAHATTIELTAQLGAVVAEPLFGLAATELDLRRHIAGLVLVLQVADGSLLEHLDAPTDYEARSAWFIGRCGDGFLRVTKPLAAAAVAAPDALQLTTALRGVGASGPAPVVTSSADYRYRLGPVLAMLTHGMTLLPGDLVTLGAAGPPLRLAADRPVDGGQLTVEAAGLGKLELQVRDLRNAAAQQDNSHFF